MEIRLVSLTSGAAAAVGTTLIIDVFRAFTTAAVAFSRGAYRIIMVDSLDKALALRSSGVGPRHRYYGSRSPAIPRHC